MAYMLDFWGRAPAELTEEKAQRVLESRDFKGEMAEYGALPQQIEKWAAARKLIVTDRGFGSDRWHIGIPFDEFGPAIATWQAAERDFAEAFLRKWVKLKLMNGWGGCEEGQENCQCGGGS
jgi:hypothetical protein